MWLPVGLENQTGALQKNEKKFSIVSKTNIGEEQFKVDAKDRMYQFWERNSLSIELCSPAVFAQKMEYIHYNPVKAGLCNLPEEYYYSSAKFYATGTDDFGMLTHWN